MKFENIKYTPTLDRILEKAEEYAHQYQYGTIESAHFWLQWQRPQVQLHTASLLE